MRKPARQHPPNKAEELAVRTDPDRRLTDRQRNQLRVARQRRPPPPGRDRVLISEHIRCNNKGFQIRHLELQSRGDTGLEALLRSAAGPCQPTRLSHQASSTLDAMAIDAALEQVEAQLQEMGQRVVSAVHGAMRALEERDEELASEVIAFDDEVDRHFLAVEHQIQSLLALQTPVARDLRLLLAMLHIDLLLERSADGCVTIAKLSQLVSDV